MATDANDLRVLEVLVDERGTATALRIEVVWSSRREGQEPQVWSRNTVVVAAVGPLADVHPGDRLELRPMADYS